MACGMYNFNDILKDAVIHVNFGHFLLDPSDLLKPEYRLYFVERLIMGMRLYNVDLDFGRRITHRQSYQKTVHLGLG
jgi:hypothetical protein